MFLNWSQFRRQRFNDLGGFDTDIDDPLYRSDEVAGVVEPAVGVVDDTAVFVLLDFVTVDEPFEWCPAVNDGSGVLLLECRINRRVR